MKLNIVDPDLLVERVSIEYPVSDITFQSNPKHGSSGVCNAVYLH